MDNLKRFNEYFLNENAKAGENWYGVHANVLAKTDAHVGPDQFWVVATSEDEAVEKLKKYAGTKESYIKRVEKVTQITTYGPASKMSKEQYESAIK